MREILKRYAQWSDESVVFLSFSFIAMGGGLAIYVDRLTLSATELVVFDAIAFAFFLFGALTWVVWSILYESEDEGFDDDGGDSPDEPEDLPEGPSWWGEFERDFRHYSERQPVLR